MKKTFFCMSFLIVVSNSFADFIVRNDSDKKLLVTNNHGIGLYMVESKKQTFEPHKEGIYRALHSFHPQQPQIRFIFFNPMQFTVFRIPSNDYGLLLQNAKKYMPTVTVTQDPKTGNPIIDIPLDEKALKQAIEKVKEEARKENAKEISKKVKETVPQLPSCEQGTGRVTGLIGEYAAHVEEE